MVDRIAPGVETQRVPVEGRCSGCGAQALSRYPVLSEGGWHQAVKCGVCLRSAERMPWHRLGYVVRDDVGEGA